MQCFFDSQLLSQLVKATKKLKHIIVPAQEGLLQQSLNNVLHCVRKLERSPVDET